MLLNKETKSNEIKDTGFYYFLENDIQSEQKLLSLIYY